MTVHTAETETETQAAEGPPEPGRYAMCAGCGEHVDLTERFAGKVAGAVVGAVVGGATRSLALALVGSAAGAAAGHWLDRNMLGRCARCGSALEVLDHVIL